MRELRRALVLGGSGFIGGWLTEELIAQGVAVVTVDQQLTASVVGDLIAEHSPDAVFHLVGAGSVPPSLEDPIGDLRSNAGTCLEVLEALRRIEARPMLVFTSSAAVYGDAQYLPMDEEHPLLPKSPYGIAKVAAEHYVRLYSGLYGLAAASVRPFSVYGPGQRKLVVYDLLVRLHGGERPLTMLGSPEVSRDLVYVEDVARALVTVARSAPGRGEPYNIASGRGTTLAELARTLVEVSGMDAEVQFTGEVRPGDPLRWTGDPGRAESLGASCDTPLREGLRRTAEWFDDEVRR